VAGPATHAAAAAAGRTRRRRRGHVRRREGVARIAPIAADLRADGWQVSKKTVADSMRRQGLVARKVKHRRGLTKQDKTAPTFTDLLKRDFTAPAPNLRWCGDITEIPTRQGKLYLATVIDLYSRRLLAAATSLRCDAELCKQAIKIAATVRGGKSRSTMWCSTPTADRPTPLNRSPGFVLI
jgi:putative transposase